MIPDRTDLDFIDRYIDMQSETYEKKYIPRVKIVVCVFFYVAVAIIQALIPASKNISGIIAQLQVMISVYLVSSVMKKGYIIAVIMNVMQSLIVLRLVFLDNNTPAAPGVVVPLCTIITMTIIYRFGIRLDRKFAEARRQKEELLTLYEEIAATEEELSQQNKQLVEYNLAMKENEEKLNYLAFFDVLTELPNRKMVINRLDLLITLSTKKQMNFAVVFIDLDNFKRINDSMGHHAGDMLLQAVALRLKSLIHQDDMLGRLGGDEFALIIQRQLKDENILEYVESLRAVLLDSFLIERAEISISASFGISIYPRDGHNSVELLKCADTAMYKTKDYGKNGVQFFCKEMKDDILKIMEFENKLLASIRNGELSLVFQPQYAAATKKLRGFEVLTRWQSAELGYISPVKFIPVAEGMGFIVTMGEWILRKACEKFKYIQNKYNIYTVISVNISAVQIMEPMFVKMVKNVLEETEFNAKYLEFEVTESVFISSVEYVSGVLKDLKELGISIALDDFGTGYSSLSYLQKLPIDTLKIDKSFIDTLNNTNERKQIVGSIISLVHQMDMWVVAEGVENEIQLNYLQKHDCDCIQGFLWGRPLDEEDLEQLFQ